MQHDSGVQETAEKVNGVTETKAVQQQKDTKGVKKEDVTGASLTGVVVTGVVVTGVDEPGVVRRKPYFLPYLWGALFWFSICTDLLLPIPRLSDTTPVTESGVRQELVETGATLYGFKRTNLDQMTNVGLNYVDCEAEAALCRGMNVTSYPTWQINGQLYAGLSSLEKLSELLGHGCHEPYDPPSTVLRLSYSEIAQRITLHIIYSIIYSIIVYSPAQYKTKGETAADAACVGRVLRLLCLVLGLGLGFGLGLGR